MKHILLLVIIATSILSCRTTKRVTDNSSTDLVKRIHQQLTTDSIFQYSHSGLVVKDLQSGKILIDHKGSHFYTPASNTKLLTFYTSLNVLGDSIIGLKYYETNDSLIIWGTGDPSFLYHKLENNDHFTSFLKETDKDIYLSLGNYHDERYGEGWCWDDYKYSYQVEKSAFPMYGNVVSFQKEKDTLKITPSSMRSSVVADTSLSSLGFIRDELSNHYRYNPGLLEKREELDIQRAYIQSPSLTASLLSEHLGQPVALIEDNKYIDRARPIYSVPADSLYKLLLQPSDNFVAEQLLLNCGSTLFDTLNVQKVIKWSSENLLQDMPNTYQWVDGSGLTRYNLTTPHNMVYLLSMIDKKVARERLFELLPTGGESGTIKNWYAADQPYVHAKTGTLRNNHSLSGYLVGDSGKTYAFSFMNSNYTVSNNELKTGMEKVLQLLKQNL